MEQQTKEWFEIKKGKMSASHAQQIGNCGKGLETYVIQLVSDLFSNGEREELVNKDVERGNELEPIARGVYELETDSEVLEIGFVEYDEFCGCSPDGFIGEEGGIEIKCPNDFNYFKLLMDEKIDTKYLWQIQMSLLLTGRKWWDFIAYNPNFERSTFIRRIRPDFKMQADLQIGIREGSKIIRHYIQKYNSN